MGRSFTRENRGESLVVKKIFKVVIALALIGAIVWVVSLLFPSEETKIRRELLKLSERASFTGQEGNFKSVATASSLASQFAPDAEIIVEVPGRGLRTWRGRPEIQQTVFGAMKSGITVKIEFYDFVVTVAPDELTATVELTAKIYAANNLDSVLQELQFQMSNGESGWIVEQIKTLQTFE